MIRIIKSFLIASIVLTGLTATAQINQNANPRIGGITSNPAVIGGVGRPTVTTVVVSNGGLDPIPAATVSVNVSFNQYFHYVSTATSPSFSVFFADPGGEFVILRNTVAIPALQTVMLTFNAISTAITPTPTSGGYGAQISIIPGQGANVGNTQTLDDNASSVIVVTAVVPVRLNELTAEPTTCSAKLKWSTSLEENLTSFDIEYSPDNRNFVRVGTVAGRQSSTGSAYEYTYAQGNGRGYYRLKMGNPSGGYTYSAVVNANIKCDLKKAFVYPNPVKADEDINVNISNYDGKIEGELVASDGKIILTKTLQNGLNKISLTGLAQGTYQFRVRDNAGEKQSFKVVIFK